MRRAHIPILPYSRDKVEAKRRPRRGKRMAFVWASYYAVPASSPFCASGSNKRIWSRLVARIFISAFEKNRKSPVRHLLFRSKHGWQRRESQAKTGLFSWPPAYIMKSFIFSVCVLTTNLREFNFSFSSELFFCENKKGKLIFH